LKTTASLLSLLLIGTFVAAPVLLSPLASAGTNVCAWATCTSTNVDSHDNVQTWTCGGSGNVIIQNGDNDSANFCNGGSNHTA
jgi:hypothetical protein